MTPRGNNSPFPIKRALLAILTGTACGLLLMPAVTLLPRLLFWGGPFGPAFAPLIGLVMGAVLAPLTALLAVAALSSIVIGLTKLSRTRDFARRRWLWLVCGLASGAAAGTALPFELVMFGIDLPGTAISGGITGMICVLVARRIMRL